MTRQGKFELAAWIVAALGTAAAVSMSGCSRSAVSDEPEAESERSLYVVRGTGDLVEGPEPVIDLDVVESDIGQLRQGLAFAPTVSGSLQPGITPDTQYSCLHGATGQNCIVPPNNILKYVVIGENASINNTVDAMMQSIRLALISKGMLTCSQNWCPKISKGASINDSTLTLVIDANGNNNAFCSDGTPSEIHGYQCFTGQTTGITPSGLSGTYHRWLKPGETSIPVAHIDYNPIMLRNGWTQTEKNRAVWHAAASMVLAFFGKGLVNAGHQDGRCTDAAIWTTQNCVIRTADACFLNGIGDNANLSSVWQGGSDCGS